MQHIMTNSSLPLKAVIRHIWDRLTDEEIESCDKERDVFFLAVKKKHGLTRAEAELVLKDIKEAA